MLGGEGRERSLKKEEMCRLLLFSLESNVFKNNLHYHMSFYQFLLSLIPRFSQASGLSVQQDCHVFHGPQRNDPRSCFYIDVTLTSMIWSEIPQQLLDGKSGEHSWSP